MSRTTTDALLPEDALAEFARAIEGIVAREYPDAPDLSVGFEAPRRPEFGDFATNVSFSLAKVARRKPDDVANTLIARLRDDSPDVAAHFSSIDAVSGFINLRIAPGVWHAALAHIVHEGPGFGRSAAIGSRISLEFGSANPTGPLVVVQGRTLSIGDALARAMRYCGYDVFVEWIINDAGSQIDTLGRSLYARYMQQYDASFPFPEEGYPGEYLLPIAKEIARIDGERWRTADEREWLPHFSKVGRDTIVTEQQVTAKRFGVSYDLWQSERELHDNGKVREDIEHLSKLGHTYEADNALFFRASEFGDDKDRVVIRKDGRPTYYGADIAYHYEKLKRAERVIDILGPDHHGYIGRLKGLAEALGYPGQLDVMIAQQITLMRGDEIVSMSKRAGNIVTLDDILDEVGIDAARFFFTMLATDSPLTFDMKLAVEASNENPVYYVQYGHARIASVLKNADAADVSAALGADLSGLGNVTELALIRRLAELPKVVRAAVEHLAPHRLAKYSRDVASDFHQFYTEHRVLVDERDTRLARLALCIATKTVLAAVLDLLGVSAPESM